CGTGTVYLYYDFTGWATVSGTAAFASAGSATTTVTLTSGDATILANYGPPRGEGEGWGAPSAAAPQLSEGRLGWANTRGPRRWAALVIPTDDASGQAGRRSLYFSSSILSTR